MSEEVARLLGKIEGKLDMVIANQETQGTKIDGMDTRLRKVETKSTLLGAGAGALVSVGVALMIEKGKRTIGL
ncbi:MAG: hypothetical protein JNL77_03110 [Nitrosomonas sp.]|nr:hypothetical protein [Nitrosomonas sp.]